MHTSTFTRNTDTPDSDDVFTDTSIFNAEEIVRQLENTAAAKEAVMTDTRVNARRRAEMLREQKRLEAELADLDGMDFDD
ncbi:MAG: hypothetical protein AB8G16_06095 [Gammaproteobacteria bacterium]